jgi:hypothetical protein
VTGFVAVTAAQPSATRTERLRQQAQRQVRIIERAKTTLRFFEKHAAKLVYAKDPKVKRRAWHAIALARQRIILGRAALARIRAQLEALRIPSIPHRAAWLCIHRHEAGWRGTDNKTHDTYFGGLQMDRDFMSTYGKDMLRKYGGRYANHWTPTEQMVVAERAWRDRGFYPWPHTARSCGLL